MKKILLATVAVLPLIAVGMSPASSQDLKQQDKGGVSQPQQGKSDAGKMKMNQAAGAQEKATQEKAAQEKSQGKSQLGTEGRASSGRDATAGTADRNAPKGRANQGKVEQGKQADQGNAKPGSSKSGHAAAGNAQQEQNAGSKSQVSQGRNDAQSKGKQNAKETNGAQSNGKNEPARTTGQATRPNQENAQKDQRNQNPRNQNNERAQKNGRETQGSQASGRVTLDESQRTKIERTVLSGRDVPRADRVDFRIDVGVEVPHEIRIREVPETLVEIDSQWRGDEYFVVRDEIVIVDHSRKIVAVVPVRSSSTSIETRSFSSVDSGQPDIRRVQEVLIEKGFYHGRADGVLGSETKQALIRFQEREGIHADGRIDERTSVALGISVGTEGRAGQTEEKKPGQSDRKRSTSGQAGRDVTRSNDNNAKDNNAKNDANKSDANKSGVNKTDANKGNAGKSADDKAGQNNRPTTSGQGGNSGNAAAGEKASGQTSGQGGRRPAADENKASGQPSGTTGQAMKPQNQPASGAAGDNKRKRDQ